MTGSPDQEADPFGTAALRAAVLDSWQQSPTRFTEDANAEEDLRLGAYADRLFVELAQNAADAASLAGVGGRLRVRVVDGELRVANTGAPLDRDGVTALASLRASAKSGASTVGRFGVGFAAVLTVCAEPRVVSRTGGVAFSETGTRRCVADIPEARRQAADRGGAVPVLRLPWPVPAGEPDVPEPFDTEVRLPLADGVEEASLLAEFAGEVTDVLLTFPALERVDIAGEVWTRTDTGEGIVEIARSGAAGTRWLVHSTSGEFSGEQAATLGIEAAHHPQWTVLWALPVDGENRPRPVDSDVLHAPTATDERLSLPARLIASVPVEPSRRRVRGGLAASAVLAAAADAFLDLVRRVPAHQRLELVPAAGFPASDVDGELHQLIGARLREQPWLPAASGGRDISGDRAAVLDVDSPGLVELLGEVVAELVAVPYVGGRAAGVLARVGARGLDVAAALDALMGIERPPRWWYGLYGALLALLDDRSIDQEALTGLPVPLADGRTTPGPRGVLLPGGGAEGDTGLPRGSEGHTGLRPELLELLGTAGVTGVRVVHPDAVHPLLERLGAVPAGPAELLDAAELRAAVESSVDDAMSGLDTTPLAELVLRLVAETGATTDERPGLAALALTSASGDARRADELVLPSAPLLGVLDPEAVGPHGPLDVLAEDVARHRPPEVLTATGVLDSFAVVADDDPVGPEHDLPEEPEWWDSTSRPPSRVLAVRDLDLVADDAWPAALRLLAESPDSGHALREPGGHTGWWIARFADLDGACPRSWRMPDAVALEGLYDPVPDVGLPRDVLVAAGVREDLAVCDASDAADLLARLADRERAPRPGVVLRAHAALAELAARPGFDVAQVDAPTEVRALDGGVIDAGHACVLDQAWPLEVVDAGLLVGCGRECDSLAELLDLPLAREVYAGEVTSEGDVLSWTELSAIRDLADLLGTTVPEGGLYLHPRLTVRVDGQDRQARWWVAADGLVHAEDSIDGLARAYAFAADRWEARHQIAALLSDPEPATLFG
ncbi:molecular chaperone Hsp90 [Haloechinothrix sp. YIM 98757]|uniref:Molecular chaperone Hsp90 n=1 Tax=Haloechinothrix aidingensis TaxID=2752311 RepID=A0A838AEM2_9PSEU|nr:molecular chaperone Hsp90 [Haloechinothrix aidingensis]